MLEPDAKSSNKKNIRFTKQRQSILDILKQQESHLSAEEIYQLVKMIHPNISLGTVYRNLEILTESGAIYRTEFANGKARYEMASAGHHHHLVCLKCGDIEDMTACPMAAELQHFIEDREFQPLQHCFEVYGFCKKCKN